LHITGALGRLPYQLRSWFGASHRLVLFSGPYGLFETVQALSPATLLICKLGRIRVPSPSPDVEKGSSGPVLLTWSAGVLFAEKSRMFSRANVGSRHDREIIRFWQSCFPGPASLEMARFCLWMSCSWASSVDLAGKITACTLKLSTLSCAFRALQLFALCLVQTLITEPY